jgi:uncharacterized protein YggE
MPTAYRAKLAARWSTTLALTGLAVIGVSGCDADPGPAGAATRQVTVVGTGEVQGVPDALTADVSIEFTAPDVTTAMNQTSERQQTVIDALVNAAVDRKDISTTQVSLQPQYSSDSAANPTITGYRASNAITVKIREVESASKALALIVSTGGDATRINSVSFSIDNDSQLVRDARARAFEDARNRAEQYAQLSGLRLGKVISIAEESGGGSPAPVRTPPPRSALAAPIPLEPGQQTVSFSVTAVWQLG